MMASAQEIARRIRSNSSHSRETIRGPIKATSPASTSNRRVSEGVITERPISRCGQRPSSGGFFDDQSENSDTSNEVRPYSRQRPCSSKSLDNADLTARRAHMLQRQNATTVDPDEHPHFSPKPPPQSSSPMSAKGRPRSRSGVRPSSRSRASPEHVDVNSNDSPLPQQFHQPRGSFSKYSPLPSIGSQPSTASSAGSQQQSQSLLQQCTMERQRSGTCSSEFVQQVTQLSLSKHRTLPSEPSEDDPDRIQLAVKVLDGSRHERWFQRSNTLEDVLAFAESVSGDAELPENCEICTNDLPRKVFKDMSLTLDLAGLQSRTVLHIQES